LIGVVVAEGKIHPVCFNHPVGRAGVRIEAIRSGLGRDRLRHNVQVESVLLVVVARIDLNSCLVVGEIFIAGLVGLLMLMNANEEALHDLGPIPFMLAIFCLRQDLRYCGVVV